MTASSTLQLALPDSEATATFGQVLARTRPERAVAYLRGELGAGKSTLARAMLRALGVVGTVRSPTYTLVEEYTLDDGGRSLHLDLYRIGDAGELEFLGLSDSDAALWLVEWPERGRGALPAPDLEIRLAIKGQGRRADVQARSGVGKAWISRLQEVGCLRPLLATG